MSSYLNHSLEGLVALLVGPRLGQVAAHPHVLAQEDLEIQIEFGNPLLFPSNKNYPHLSVVLEPVQDLLDVLLEEPERQPLVELDLLLVPLGLQRAVVGQDLVDDGQDVGGALGVVGGRSRVLGAAAAAANILFPREEKDEIIHHDRFEWVSR